LTSRHLETVAELFEARAGYEAYDVQKRRGGFRTIYVADLEVSSVLKLVYHALDASGVYAPPACVHGYVRGRGIRSNASQHLDRDVVLGVDLQDFFPSISFNMVEDSLVRCGLHADEAHVIARATTIAGTLPPGLSTSPFLSNVAFFETDAELVALAEARGVSYTRFADDLSFSGSFSDELLEELTALLGSRGWHLNDSKTRFMRRGGPQYVTGLYVGRHDRPHVPRRIKRRLRQQLHYMALYGFADVHRRDQGEAMFHNQAAGWIRYIGDTDPPMARKLEAILEEIDFADEYLYWSDPDDWTPLLKQIGM
jgi:hypothetical protein